jgi:hypothetical protein
VPRFDLILKPGDAIPDELSAILEKRLSPAFREKLLKHGGLVRISVASPYVDRKSSSKKAFTIDETFIHELESIAQDGEDVRMRLQSLPLKQLRDICRRLDLPVRSNSSSREIREAIIRRLQAGRLWDNIANSGKE